MLNCPNHGDRARIRGTGAKGVFLTMGKRIKSKFSLANTHRRMTPIIVGGFFTKPKGAMRKPDLNRANWRVFGGPDVVGTRAWGFIYMTSPCAGRAARGRWVLDTLPAL